MVETSKRKHMAAISHALGMETYPTGSVCSRNELRRGVSDLDPSFKRSVLKNGQQKSAESHKPRLMPNKEKLPGTDVFILRKEDVHIITSFH